MEEAEKSTMRDTQCAHIFPQSTDTDTSGSNKDSAKVRTHVLLHLSHCQLLAPNSSMLRLYGLL